MSDYDFQTRELFAKDIATSLKAVSCEDIPNEFSRKGWVWSVDNYKFIIKMSPEHLESLNNEIQFSTSGWNRDKWKVPEIIGLHYFKDDPTLPALVYKPVQGKIFSWEDVSKLSHEKQKSFALDFSRMVADFHLAHNVQKISHVGMPIPMSVTVDEFFKKLPRNTDLNEYGRRLAEDLVIFLMKIQNKLPAPDDVPQVILHADMNIQNLVFDENDTLIGVFDFSNAYKGRPFGEFCFILNASYELGRIALEKYLQITRFTSPSEIEIWSEMAIAALSGLVHRRGNSLPLAIHRAEVCLGLMP